MKCDFSYQHYQIMLKKALSSGYKIGNFKNFKEISKSPRWIILRHDIDYSPKRALNIARLEKALGIKSTFFVRVHGEHYHPLAKDNREILQEILRLGHELGLHYEARTFSSRLGQKPKEIFLWEKAILELGFKIKIESASEHRDIGGKTQDYKFFSAKKTVGIKQETYEKRFQKFYLADSCNAWNKGCLCLNLGQSKIQLLTHPDLWGPGAIGEVREKVKKIGLEPIY